jgi:hypothetical protein
MRKEIYDHLKVGVLLMLVVAVGFSLLKDGGLSGLTGSTAIDVATDEEIKTSAGAINLRAILALIGMFVLVFGAFGVLLTFRHAEAKRLKHLHMEHYVKKAKDKGFEDEHIHQRLVEHGWEPKDILHNFKR